MGTLLSEKFVSENHPGIVEHTFHTGEGQLSVHLNVHLDVHLNVDLNYAEGPSNGPPLVLLHGLGPR